MRGTGCGVGVFYLRLAPALPGDDDLLPCGGAAGEELRGMGEFAGPGPRIESRGMPDQPAFRPSPRLARMLPGRLKVATERDPGDGSCVEAPLAAAELPKDGEGPITVRSISVSTRPWRATLEEMCLSSPKPSRGMPRPAELLRKVKVPGAEMLETASGRALTGTIAGAPRRGGAGAAARARFPAAGTRVATFWRPTHAAPGCHPQPAAPQDIHVPEWKGSQPHG